MPNSSRRLPRMLAPNTRGRKSGTLGMSRKWLIPVLQIERAKAVKAEFIRKAEHQAHEGRKTADILADGVIVGVGLIQRDKGDSGSH